MHSWPLVLSARAAEGVAAATAAMPATAAWPAPRITVRRSQ